WSFSRPIQRSAVADRGTSFVRVTDCGLPVTLMPVFFVLAQFLLVFVAGKTFYNSIAAHPVESQIRLIVVTRFLEIRGPTLDVGTVSCLCAARNRHVSILGECEKCRLSEKGKWGCIVWR